MSIIKNYILIPFGLLIDNYYPHILLWFSFLALLGLIAIDPAMSFYTYLFMAKKDSLLLETVNYASSESHDSALKLFWTCSFLYLVKTDGKFVDKLISLLSLLRSGKKGTK